MPVQVALVNEVPSSCTFELGQHGPSVTTVARQKATRRIQSVYVVWCLKAYFHVLRKAKTEFISSGNSESPVTASEVDHDAETFDNCHSTNPDHGQGVFASSWRAGSEQD